MLAHRIQASTLGLFGINADRRSVGVEFRLKARDLRQGAGINSSSPSSLDDRVLDGQPAPSNSQVFDRIEARPDHILNRLWRHPCGLTRDISCTAGSISDRARQTACAVRDSRGTTGNSVTRAASDISDTLRYPGLLDRLANLLADLLSTEGTNRAASQSADERTRRSCDRPQSGTGRSTCQSTCKPT